jgi:uncharacterized secreted protein with C-terminal beta-propeller domain
MNLFFRLALITSAIFLVNCAKSPSNETREGVFTSTIQKFSSCQDMRSSMEQANSSYGEIFPINATPVMDNAGNSPALYDTQSANVLESDKVLVNNQHIFVLRDGVLEVLNRSSLNIIKSIPIDLFTYATMIISHNQVILLGSKDSDKSILIFLNANSLALEKQITIDGMFRDVRIHKDQLLLLTNSYSPTVDSTQEKLNAKSGIVAPKCNEVYRPQVSIYNQSLTLLYNFSLTAPHLPPTTTGFAGQSDVFYMTENALYLLSNSYFNFPSHIRKVVWDQDSIELKSVATYAGHVKDRWSVNEYNDTDGVKLALATMVMEATEEIGPDNTVSITPNQFNQGGKILILKEANSTMTLLSESALFGKNETIRSVRFLNDLVYVVTFRTTDPLFVFDLSNRNQIQLRGELKVPGFSTHLRSLSKNDLLGVGFDAIEKGTTAWQQGVQVSLFDVSNSTAPKRKSVFTMGVRGSNSEATFDAHALMYNEPTGLIALPIIEWLNPEDSNPWSYGTVMNFAGAQVYRYTQGQLVNAGRITHNKWRANHDCEHLLNISWIPGGGLGSADISRILVLDGRLLSISRFGIMAHNTNTLSVVAEQPFTAGPKGFCPAQYYY